MAQNGMPAVTLFYCYAQRDREMRDELDKHLMPLKRSGLIESWYDGKIVPGAERDQEIKRQLTTAQIVLLLISPDFMASDYCYEQEMKVAIRRHERGSARVIPIILRDTLWENTPFSALQVLPMDGKPIRSSSDRDRAFADVARAIQMVVTEISIKIWLNRGNDDLKERRYKEALAAFERVLSLDDRRTSYTYEALVGKSNILLYFERYQDAVVVSDLAIKLNPNTNAAYISKAAALLKLKQYKEVLSACEQALRLDTKSAIAYRYKGTALNSLNRKEEALNAYEQAIRFDRANALLHLNKGDILSHLKKQKEALAAYDQAIALNPSYVLAYMRKAELLFRLKRYEEALVTYDQVMPLDTTNPPHVKKGDVLFTLERYGKALNEYNLAIHFERANAGRISASTRIKQGDALYQLEHYEEALNAYEQACRANTNDTQHFLKKGLALAQLKRYAEALVAFEEAIRLIPRMLRLMRTKDLPCSTSGNTKRPWLFQMKPFASTLVIQSPKAQSSCYLK